MAKFLTPFQVGLLAAIVQEAIEKYPNSPPEVEETYQDGCISFTTKHKQSGMEDWEQFVKTQVDKMSQATSANGSGVEPYPNYDAIIENHSDVLEFLVHYYGDAIERAEAK